MFHLWMNSRKVTPGQAEIKSYFPLFSFFFFNFVFLKIIPYLITTVYLESSYEGRKALNHFEVIEMKIVHYFEL